MLAGLGKAGSGTRVECSAGRPLAGRIAYMHQRDMLLPWLDVLGNVTLDRRLRGALGAGLMTVASQPGGPFGPGHDGLTWGGRAFVGGFALEDAGVKKDGKFELDYWCDICAIGMYESGPCDCCQEPNRLRERRVEGP